MNSGSIDANIDIDNGEISLPNYPFPTLKRRTVSATDIVEVIDWFPPTIRMKDDELLMVSRSQLDELTAFCDIHKISFESQYDAWSDLLEPFLDTELSFSTRKNIFRRLTEAGFSKPEIRAVRKKVSRRMWQYTYATWEWQHYGMYDLLHVMQPRWLIGNRRWREFYRWSMEVAKKGIQS